MSSKNNISLGQHWLYNRAILNEIAELAGEGPLCVEIGPGLGTLTSSLLKRFEKVVAVEFDADLARKLPGSFPGKNLEVINQDFLKYDLDSLPQPYAVAGNIPYYITSPIIEHILAARNLPENVVLLIPARTPGTDAVGTADPWTRDPGPGRAAASASHFGPKGPRRPLARRPSKLTDAGAGLPPLRGP